MSRGGYDVIGVAISAGAGIGGITLGSAGGRSYLGAILMGMTKNGDALCLGFAAGSALEGFYAFRSLSCRRGDSTVIPRMSRGGYEVIGKAMAAGAGIGGITLGSTGGRSHLFFIAMEMRESGYGLRLGLSAIGAGIAYYTFAFFCSLPDYSFIAPKMSVGLINDVCVAIAAGTNICYISVLCAGSRGHLISIPMDMLNFFYDFRLGYAAVVAGVGYFSLFFLSGRLSYSSNIPPVLMRNFRNFSCFKVSAVDAGGAFLSGFIDSGLFDYIPCFIVMSAGLKAVFKAIPAI